MNALKNEVMKILMYINSGENDAKTTSRKITYWLYDKQAIPLAPPQSHDKAVSGS